MTLEPVCECISLSVREQIDRASALEADQDRAVALATALGPVVQAEHPRVPSFRPCGTSDCPDQRIWARVDAQLPSCPRAGLTTEHEPDQLNGLGEPFRPTGARLGDSGQALGEDLPRTFV